MSLEPESVEPESLEPASAVSVPRPNPLAGFSAGAAIGTIGGLIGLGGAEIRLPVLIAFGFEALPAVIINKALSLVVVISALPFRAATVPYGEVAQHWPVIVTMLSGSLLGAWVGASFASKIASRSMFRIIAGLLAFTALMLIAGADPELHHLQIDGTVRHVVGVASGFAIGMTVSMMGVAGGELLVPTLVLLFGLNVKLAGSVALVISLPTILVGFARFGRDNSIAVLSQNLRFLAVMAAGSATGTFIGGRLLGLVPTYVLLPVLGFILILSAIKIWRHGEAR